MSVIQLSLNHAAGGARRQESIVGCPQQPDNQAKVPAGKGRCAAITGQIIRRVRDKPGSPAWGLHVTGDVTDLPGAQRPTLLAESHRCNNPTGFSGVSPANSGVSG